LKSASSSISVAERLKQIGSAKLAGNDHISQNEFSKAASQYRKGIKVLEDMRKANLGENPLQLADSKEVC
jgi:hypothetical protein